MPSVYTLNRRLLTLAAASIGPLALMAGVGLYALQARQRAESDRVGIELARSVANAVGAELRATESVIETLATTPVLDQLDLPGFLHRAGRVLETRPNWVGIVLTDPLGMPLADTRAPDGHTTLPLAERESLQRAARTGRAEVGPLTRDAGRWVFSVSVPVRREGVTFYVVGALVSPDVVRDVLQRQNVPPDWVISIVDADGRRVARSRAHEETLGGRLSDTVSRVVASGGTEGVDVAYALEGERILTSYARLASSGWVAVLGIPTAIVDAGVYRAVALYAAGVLVSLGIATFASIRLARTIARPVRALGLAAGAMAGGERPRIPGSTIREIAAAGSALGQAFDDLQRAAAEREGLLRAERTAREAAESSDRAKEQFLAVLSHELRTPLNAVSGWARMLQSGQLGNDPALTERAIKVIVRNADVQSQLIDDLLDLSRITSGKLQLRLCATDLTTVLRNVLEAARPAADARHITLHSAFAPDVGSISGDPERLEQVAWNLVMNAVKFTPEGGTIEVRLQRRDADVEMRVRDTGCGIAADVLPRIFDQFQQGDSSSTRAHGGLGLGLSLVKTLVELHGGTVLAESDGEGCGATFTVTFPRVATAGSGDVSAVHLPEPTTANGKPYARLDGLRVLFVDDDSEGVLLGHEVLHRAGAEVRTCASARDARDMFRQWRPDVLVSDIEMPGEDGYQLIRSIRALTPGQGGTTPALALTAYNREQDRHRSLDAGFDIHVPKPVDPAELTSIVADLARPRKTSAT
jgi:signal transduction histidine kinase/CheY-like chemotaxis protein